MSSQKSSSKVKTREKSSLNENNVEVEKVMNAFAQLPLKDRRKIGAQISLSQISHSGPLPLASEFKGYELTTPRAGDRILRMAENQSQHRQAIEKYAVNTQLKITAKGQWFGFILGMVGLIGGFILIALNKDAIGVSTLIGTTTTLAGVYWYSRKDLKKQ